MLKNLFKGFLVTGLISILAACGTNASSDNLQYINVGTAGTGGAYYPIGVAVSEVITKEFGANVTAQVTGGAVENITLIDKGELEVAITQSPIAAAGINGAAPFKSKNENVTTLFNGLSKGVLQVVVSDKSDINTLSDLKGKKVVLGPSGGGAINVVQDVLSVYDIKVEDLQPTYVSYDEGISMLADNNVDAVIVQSAAPASSIKELSATGKKFKMISLEPDKIKELLGKFSYLDETKLPADMYSTPDEISTVYLTNMMVVRKDLSEEAVYRITKSIFDNLEKIKSSHPSAKGLTLEKAATRVPIPLHPGAERYFKEKGVLH